MKAKELRINNYLYDAKERLAIVEEIQKDEFTAYSGSITTLPLKPIPLTEDWLLKFGFTCHWDEDYDNHIFSLTIQEPRRYMIIDPSWISQTECEKFILVHFDFQMDLEIKHVHQLQNLYFALSGEELTINQDE